MQTLSTIRTTMAGLLALSVLAGVAATAAKAVENDNDRSTYNAREFYQKLDQERGSN